MNNEVYRINNFLNMKAKKDLLKILNISEKQYNFIQYVKENKYSSFFINKRNGEKRKILSPCPELKKILKELNIILYENYSFNKNSHGFIKNKSIITNAAIHEKANYVLNIDLKDFFDTIHFGRVRGMLMNKPFNFNNYIATNLANLVCYNGKLPQGSPTSPTISNMICFNLDNSLRILCHKYGCKYTRYADDITISSKNLTFPAEIAHFNNNKLILGKELRRIIINNGFIINSTKSNLSNIYNRQEITGLVVNKKINVKKIYVKKLRALLYNTKLHGLYYEGIKYLNIPFDKIKNYSKKDIEYKFKNILKGKIEFLKMVKGIDDLVYIKYATMYNNLIGIDFFDVDSGKEILEYIKNRTYPILSYKSQGTCFMTKELGMITSTHVLLDKSCFINEEAYNNAKDKDNYYLSEYNKLPFNILGKDYRLYPINPLVKKENIISDFINYSIIHPNKEFNVNVDYIPKPNEEIYLAGYAEYNINKAKDIYFLSAKVTGSKIFFGRKIITISQKIYHGMSGGPVLNNKRDVIGIIYAGLNATEHGDGAISANNGFILFNDIKDAIYSIKNNDKEKINEYN